MQIQVAIANMPVNLVLLSNSTLAFVRVAQFKALFDTPPFEYGISAAFYEEDFSLGGETFAYNTAYEYKNIPNMLKWLQQQRLQLPNIIAGF